MVSDIASRTLKRVLEASPMPLTLASPVFEGCPLILANDAFLALTGYARDDVVGRSCNMLQGPASDEAVRAEMRTAVAEAREATVQITNYRRDGSRFMNLVFLMPVFAGDGRLLYMLGSQCDITAPRRHALASEHASELDRAIASTNPAIGGEADLRIATRQPLAARIQALVAEDVR